MFERCNLMRKLSGRARLYGIITRDMEQKLRVRHLLIGTNHLQRSALLLALDGSVDTQVRLAVPVPVWGLYDHHVDGHRLLTVRELARIQSFPGKVIFSCLGYSKAHIP